MLTSVDYQHAPKLITILSHLHFATSSEDVYNCLSHVANLLDFDFFFYSGRFSSPQHKIIEHTLSNYPKKWQERYKQLGYEKLDPIWQHSLSRLTPLIWGPELFRSPIERAFYEERCGFGLQSGVTFPVFSPSGAPGALSLGISRSNVPHAFLLSVVQNGAAAAAYVHDAIHRLVAQGLAQSRPKLTKRERECLHWVAKGKTSWEISRILEISEHGVIHHLRNVMQKLNVTKRYHAVQIAHEYGLLDDALSSFATDRASK